MRHFALLAAGMLAAGALAPSAAQAEETIRINGHTVTCSNSCSVTIDGEGNWIVKDCCGGRIFVRLR